TPSLLYLCLSCVPTRRSSDLYCSTEGSSNPQVAHHGSNSGLGGSRDFNLLPDGREIGFGGGDLRLRFPPLRRRRIHFLLGDQVRSEEHTSELQSHLNLVCRLL